MDPDINSPLMLQGERRRVVRERDKCLNYGKLTKCIPMMCVCSCSPPPPPPRNFGAGALRVAVRGGEGLWGVIVRAESQFL